MVAKTFERFFRYQTGMGYEDFWNLYSIEDGENTIRELFKKWIQIENPSESWIIVARLNLKNNFGWEV